MIPDTSGQDTVLASAPGTSHRRRLAWIAAAAVGVAARLVADGRANEVRAVAEEALRHQQVDLSQIDETEVDGDLLGVGALFLDQVSGGS